MPIKIAVAITSLLFVCLTLPTQADGATCSEYNARGPSIPTGYAAPYNLFTAEKEQLVDAACEGQRIVATIGSGRSNQYVYNAGYWWSGTQWVKFSLSGTDDLVSNTWYVGSATSSFASVGDRTFFVGYVCQYIASAWKCGCRDTACTQSMWQLQSARLAASAGTGGGTATGGSLTFGVNMISTGNAYATDGYTDQNLDALFTVLKQKKIKQISVRVIWQIMEPAQGSYNTAAISNLNRIFSKADQHGLNVMLDFHTLFNGGDQGWQPPTWLSTIAPAKTANGESVPAGSIRQLWYTPAVMRAYTAMMKHVISQTQQHSSVKYISMLNEPYLNWNSSSNNQYFEATVRDMMAELRTVTSKPLGVRFLPGWNPWSDDVKKRLGTNIWRDFGYVAINLYFPTGEETTDGTNFWPMVERSITAAHGAGKVLIASESGRSSGSNAEYDAYWKSLFATRFNTAKYRPDIIQLWNVQNDGSWFVNGGFNALKSRNTFADYVDTAIAPNLR